MEEKKKILIVAGEASGDLHAAGLVEEIRRVYPGASFFGLGGARLKKQGVRIVYDLTSLAVVGFWEVIKNLGTFRKVFRVLLKDVDRQQPDLAILVDYPGFNLRLACQLHKRKIPVFYYSSPQVWAWGKGRIRLIRRVVTRMIVFFPFEEELYKKHKVPVSFVGHPLLDMVSVRLPKDALIRSAGLKQNVTTVSLLPGSREKEVKGILPIMLKSCRIINEYFFGRVQFVILRAPTVKEELLKSLCAGYDLPLSILSEMTYDTVAASDFSLVCSGTATLETALLGTPMAIIYRLNPLTFLFIRLLIRIPYIGLVNVVAGRKIVEEFIQFAAQPERIADSCIPVLQDDDRRARMKQDLSSVKNILGQPGACQRSARIIADFLTSKSPK